MEASANQFVFHLVVSDISCLNFIFQHIFKAWACIFFIYFFKFDSSFRDLVIYYFSIRFDYLFGCLRIFETEYLHVSSNFCLKATTWFIM